jgi:hypothetical protein
MGDFLKKILSEEVHPDYDYIEEGDELMEISPKQVKMILNVFKRNEVKYFTNYKALNFIRTFKDVYYIDDSVMLTKFLLVAFFNGVSDLVRAVERKDTSQLYVGPFYSATMDYWDDDMEEETDTQSDDCESCGGYGYQTSDCESCGGAGEFECDECEASGYLDCPECDGMGGDDEGECSRCDGIGEIECHSCDARGETMCGECSGSGVMEDDCEKCDGNG